MSYTKLTYHIVFATKGRRRLIGPGHKSYLYSVIAQISKENQAFIHRIGGVDDHIHILVDIPAYISVSSFVKAIKQQSSKLMRDRLSALQWFGWEEGYGAFTVSWSAIDRIKKYIENQAIHHGKLSFDDEIAAWIKYTETE